MDTKRQDEIILIVGAAAKAAEYAAKLLAIAQAPAATKADWDEVVKSSAELDYNREKLAAFARLDAGE